MRFLAVLLCLISFCAPVTGQTGKVQAQKPTGTTPVQGAKVYLFAFGYVGLGSFPTSLLTPNAGNDVQRDSNNVGYVASDSTGAFDFTGKYTCPSSSTLTYAVAVGGNPGLTEGTNNTAIHYVTVLGHCGTLVNAGGPISFSLDDLDTVMSVWTFQQFIDPIQEFLGTASVSQVEAAFSALGDLYQAVGARTGFANYSSPAQKINTIASILNACSSSASAAPCSSLFTATKPSGGTAPVDIFQAAYYMASSPARNVSQLFAILPSSPSYSDVLSSAPPDWLISISYSTGGLSAPGAIAVDASGSIWVVNPTASSVSKFNSHGYPLSGGDPGAVQIGPDGQPIPPGYFGGGLSIPVAVAIDQSGNAWIANCGTGCPNPSGQGNITELDTNGQALSPPPGFSLGGLTYSSGIAVDSHSNVWVSNDFSNSIAQLSGSGQLLSLPSGLSTASLKGPLSMTFDTPGNLWVGNSVTGSVSKFDATGAEVAGSPFSIAGLAHPLALAVDPGNNIWVINGGANTVSELTKAGLASHTSNYSGGGLQNPQALAIDSWGTVWIANANNTLSAISGINTFLSPTSGFKPDGLSSPAGIAIDQAGDVWISNSGNNTITRIIGIAKPVVTPLSTAIQTNPVWPYATAVCKDGGYSTSANRSGTCSHNGGVAEWLTL